MPKKGFKHSKASRLKMSRSRRGKKQSAELIEKRIAPLRGRKRPKWVRDAISKGRKGMKFSEEHRRNIGIASRNRPPPSEETRSLISLAGKGRTVSRKTREKIRQKLLGRKHDEKRRRNQSLSHIGKPNPHSAGPKSVFWKGGISKGRKIDNLWRLSVFQRDGYKCRHCDKVGKKNWGVDRIGLDACHIKPWETYPKLRFDVDNGITLCRPCHRKFDKQSGAFANKPETVAKNAAVKRGQKKSVIVRARMRAARLAYLVKQKGG